MPPACQDYNVIVRQVGDERTKIEAINASLSRAERTTLSMLSPKQIARSAICRPRGTEASASAGGVLARTALGKASYEGRARLLPNPRLTRAGVFKPCSHRHLRKRRRKGIHRHTSTTAVTQSRKYLSEYDLHASPHLRAECLGLGEDLIPVRSGQRTDLASRSLRCSVTDHPRNRGG